MTIPPRSLSIAHEAVAVIAGIGLVVVLAVVWDDATEIDIGAIRYAARAAVLAAVTFLFASSWLEFRASDAWRANAPARAGSWLLLAAINATVLVTVTWCMMQGHHSRAYLAGLHQPLAALGTVTCLGLALSIVTWIARRSQADDDAPRRARIEDAVCWGLYGLAGAGLVVALLTLERLPIPHV